MNENKNKSVIANVKVNFATERNESRWLTIFRHISRHPKPNSIEHFIMRTHHNSFQLTESILPYGQRLSDRTNRKSTDTIEIHHLILCHQNLIVPSLMWAILLSRDWDRTKWKFKSKTKLKFGLWQWPKLVLRTITVARSFAHNYQQNDMHVYLLKWTLNTPSTEPIEIEIEANDFDMKQFVYIITGWKRQPLCDCPHNTDCCVSRKEKKKREEIKIDLMPVSFSFRDCVSFCLLKYWNKKKLFFFFFIWVLRFQYGN